MNTKKYKCKKCEKIIESSEVDVDVEGKEVAKKSDGTSILGDIYIHKGCGGALEEYSQA